MIPRFIQTSIRALALCIALAGAAPAAVDFVQITDPHLFDKSKDPDNAALLSWSIEKINERQNAGAKNEFVVVTGDLGLEALCDFLNPDEQRTSLQRAAGDLAALLKPSKVTTWLFVPGNNDLFEEDPNSITMFKEFIPLLQAELPSFKIIDLTANDIVLPDDQPQYRFVGFDNSSFKANDSSVDGACPTLDEIRRKELQRVAEHVADASTHYAYIFYHVPEIDDPFYALVAKNDKRAERANRRRELGKDFPNSAWTVTNQVRADWDQIVGNAKVKGLFAGHFHSDNRTVYEDFAWLSSDKYLSPRLHKLWVCPPIATKNQNPLQQARGFRWVQLADDGGVTSQIEWDKRGSATPTPTPSSSPSASGGESPGESKGEPRHRSTDFHQVIRDLESFLKTLAVLLGIIGGFLAWLAYVPQRLVPSAHLIHTITPDKQGEGSTVALHVILHVHNTGHRTIRGNAATIVRLLPLDDGEREIQPVASSSRSGIIAPDESWDFYFHFNIRDPSRGVLIQSSFQRQSRLRLFASGIKWELQTIYKG